MNSKLTWSNKVNKHMEVQNTVISKIGRNALDWGRVSKACWIEQ